MKLYRTTVYRIYPAAPLESGKIAIPRRQGDQVMIGGEWMGAKIHRPLPGLPVRAYVRQEGRKTYLHLTSVEEARQGPRNPVNPVGIDVGLGAHFVILSNGRKIEKCQATGKEGKAARKDWRTKLAHELATTFDFIAVETLDLHRGDVSDFLAQLENKCREHGTGFVKVGKWFASSKICHVCGHKNEGLQVTDREWKCKKCNAVHDRDLNAAKNILNEGLKTYRR